MQVADSTTAELLEKLAAAGAGATAEGLKLAYELAAHVTCSGDNVAVPLEAMLSLVREQAKEMSSVRLVLAFVTSGRD